MKKSKIVLLCDFDGTVVNIDTGELILRRFGEGDWRSFDSKLERGEISLEECLVKQYSMIRADKKQIFAMLHDEDITIRPNFSQLIDYCKRNDFEFAIVTGGIDFCIRQILKANRLSLKIHAGKSRVKSRRISIDFPKLSSKHSMNFKEDLVNWHHKLGQKVVYVGDGSSDYEPAKNADLVFTVRKSKLSTMCERKKITHFDFEDFDQVIRGIEHWIVKSRVQLP